MRLGNVIEKPIITEKAMAQVEHNRYTFKVSKKASKKDVKRVVEDMFEVDVVSVRTLLMPGKKRRLRKTSRFIKTPSWKKALVEIKDGQKIDLFTSLIGGEK